MGKDKIENLEDRLANTKTKGDVEAVLKEIEKLLSKNNNDISLRHIRARIHIKLQNFGQAINDYKTILDIDKEDKLATQQIEQLKTILKYNNIDIYANPNTNFDPWLD